MLSGTYDGPLEPFLVENLLIRLANDELYSLGLEVGDALKETTGIKSFYYLTDPFEFSAGLVDSSDIDLSNIIINPPSGFVRYMTLTRIQISYDSGTIPKERYLNLMNSQTPGCTPGNCFCDIPGNCGRCKIYMKVCVPG